MKEARFWTRLDGSRVQCHLCPQLCKISEGKTGFCGVRKNVGGTIQSLVWGRSIAASVDPVEKKPLYHFLPGSLTFSIATVGCNLRCAFCQNADISQYPLHTGGVTGEELPPEEVVKAALARKCASISYTYTEPTIYLEYALDTAKLAREQGLANIMVTNGFINPDIVKSDLAGLIDAANIDLKSFSEDFYKRLCKARLGPVLDAIRAYHEAGVLIEITTLIIPGENDSPGELRQIARFIASVSPGIPWHLSRYYPGYHYESAPPTPVEELEEARNIGLQEGLFFVYTGNVPGHPGESTYCPGCGHTIIDRKGYLIARQDMKGDTCIRCGRTISGRFT
ncbi:MAG TPA: AmmeMemoRadiSam system radical SAM enzyme [Deltaproteobacteria bacterium]|nr:AmmeMemoRadiSam system radical SAM enzyme [Deltaproteobacteria bacterium]HOI08229.1 AmmeMemoRadiSam system radical SAM enzyme [Deltaproteobacteria bacterium]